MVARVPQCSCVRGRRVNCSRFCGQLASGGRRQNAAASQSGREQDSDSQDQPLLLRGVNAARLEWTSDGQGHIVASVSTVIKDWGVNVIRLPLAQDRWFGKAPEQKDEGVAYRALVREVVDTCATQKCYIVLDLHWSD